MAQVKGFGYRRFLSELPDLTMTEFDETKYDPKKTKVVMSLQFLPVKEGESDRTVIVSAGIEGEAPIVDSYSSSEVFSPYFDDILFVLEGHLSNIKERRRKEHEEKQKKAALIAEATKSKKQTSKKGRKYPSPHESEDDRSSSPKQLSLLGQDQ